MTHALFFFLSLGAASEAMGAKTVAPVTAQQAKKKQVKNDEVIKLGRYALYASMSQLKHRTGTIKKMSDEKKKVIMKEFKIEKIYDLDELDGRIIETDGFGIPLKMEEYVSEFMMVGDAMYCSHVAPPPPNQVIHIKMTPEAERLPIKVFGDITPFKVRGRLKVIRKKTEYGGAGFELTASLAKKKGDINLSH